MYLGLVERGAAAADGGRDDGADDLVEGEERDHHGYQVLRRAVPVLAPPLENIANSSLISTS